MGLPIITLLKITVILWALLSLDIQLVTLSLEELILYIKWSVTDGHDIYEVRQTISDV